MRRSRGAAHTLPHRRACGVSAERALPPRAFCSGHLSSQPPSITLERGQGPSECRPSAGSCQGTGVAGPLRPSPLGGCRGPSGELLLLSLASRQVGSPHRVDPPPWTRRPDPVPTGRARDVGWDRPADNEDPGGGLAPSPWLACRTAGGSRGPQHTVSITFTPFGEGVSVPGPASRRPGRDPAALSATPRWPPQV